MECSIPEVPGNGGEVVITLNVRAPTLLWDEPVTNEATVSDVDEPGDPPGNNSASETTLILACFDFDDDGVVTIADIFLVVNAFGTVASDPGYDILLDPDDKGAIVISDIFFVVRDFGLAC